MKLAHNRRVILVVAWIVILATASFKIILQEIFKIRVSETQYFVISAVIVLVGLALTLLWKPLHPLKPLFGLFVVFYAAQYLVYVQVNKLPFIQRWQNNPSFNVYMPAEQMLNLLVTLAIIVYLLVLKKTPRAFFLTMGNLSAPVKPIKPILEKPGTWKSFGIACAVFISLGTLAFLVIAGRPPLNIVMKALPFLPVVLLSAVANAFYEEVSYKASYLSVLEPVVGKTQALWLMAVFFGVWHFYGIPYGVTGVLLATFLGWLLGKSMLETRGMFWAWFIHFLQDVLIFSFLAIGSVKPGG